MPKKILIIDDDEHFVRTLNRSLERQGFTTSTATDTNSAIAECKALQPDWATLDLRMEQESGLALIPELLSVNSDLRIVMLTGYASIATAVEAVKLGAFNYLHKPATLNELLRAFGEEAHQEPGPAMPETESLMSVERLEWEHIQRVLNENDGNISATARALNMHRRTLQRKLQKHAPR